MRGLWDRHPRLSCAGLAAAIVIAVLAVLIIGLTHPLAIMAVGLVLVAVCGLGLILTKD